MNDAEFQDFKDFMFQSQAQSEVRLSTLEESMNRLVGIFSDFTTITFERFDALEGKVNILADAQIKTEESISVLAEKIGAVAEAQAHTNEKLAELAEAQAHTDKRLDALIDIVREPRNGNS